MSLLSLSANENRYQMVANLSRPLILLIISFILTSCRVQGRFVDTGESICFQHSQGTSFSQGLLGDEGEVFTNTVEDDNDIVDRVTNYRQNSGDERLVDFH